jgi:hypothetical protein
MTAIMAHRPVPLGFQGTERRAARRQRVLKGATLSFNSGYSTFECVVRNLSKNGALLSLAETFGLPARFRLLISGDEAGYMVRAAWCKSDALGVSFEPDEAADGVN